MRHRCGDFQQQARTVFSRAAIGVCSIIGAVLCELLKQIAIGAVDLNTVETGLDGIGCRLPEIIDDARKLIKLKSARLRYVSETIIHERLGPGTDR